MIFIKGRLHQNCHCTLPSAQVSQFSYRILPVLERSFGYSYRSYAIPYGVAQIKVIRRESVTADEASDFGNELTAKEQVTEYLPNSSKRHSCPVPNAMHLQLASGSQGATAVKFSTDGR